MLELEDHLVPPEAPDLRPRGDTLSDKEKAGARAIDLNLNAMHRYAREFAECIAWYQLCRHNQRDVRDLWRGWKMIAPKAAIVALFNYRMGMDGAMKARRFCPPYEKLLDNASLERTKAKFREAFPHTKELRQAILHSSERFWNPSRLKENQISKGHKDAAIDMAPGATGIIDAGFVNNTYGCLFGGILYELDMTSTNLERLVGITRDFFRPFEDIEEQLKQQQ